MKFVLVALVLLVFIGGCTTTGDNNDDQNDIPPKDGPPKDDQNGKDPPGEEPPGEEPPDDDSGYDDENIGSQYPRGTVNLLFSSNCGNFKCYDIEVFCNDLDVREARIRVNENNNSKGTIIFTTGSFGSSFYGAQSTGKTSSAELISELANKGYETYELKWNSKFGWAENNAGEGFKKIMCAYNEAFRFIQSELADNKEVMCATGNSGGSMQIGYGLALYNLEEELDYAVLSGGPPTADAVDVCFNTTVGGPLGLMDYVSGWVDNGDYCRKGIQNSETTESLARGSIVSSLAGEIRDYSYPNTIVSFIEGQFDPENTRRGRVYFDAIETEKTWKIVPGISHAVHKTEDGAQAIKEGMLANCN
ncbi:MAG: hypothetical protein IIC74_02340 [Bacteroidetes bacterium]|nr:hypothetical protein [Bacteroidota bacterium]